MDGRLQVVEGELCHAPNPVLKVDNDILGGNGRFYHSICIDRSKHNKTDLANTTPALTFLQRASYTSLTHDIHFSNTSRLES